MDRKRPLSYLRIRAKNYDKRRREFYGYLKAGGGQAAEFQLTMIFLTLNLFPKRKSPARPGDSIVYLSSNNAFLIFVTVAASSHFDQVS